jgi:hypothetical protein
MKLYHGTTGEVVRRILREGIKPRNFTRTPGNWEQTVGSNANIVYMTKAYAPYFAYCAQPEGLKTIKQEWGVVEVETDLLDKHSMLPDEDYLEQATRDFQGLPEWMLRELDGLDMKARTEWFRDRLVAFQKLYLSSLLGIGAACYLGVVPPEAITRATIFHPSEENRVVVTAALDPCITIMNYRIVGEKYRALTRWFIGERLTLEEFFAPTWEHVGEHISEEALLEIRRVLQFHPGLEVIRGG